jgi:hypothetical protein
MSAKKRRFKQEKTKSPAKHDAWQGFYFVQHAPTQEVVPNAVSRAVAMEAMI